MVLRIQGVVSCVFETKIVERNKVEKEAVSKASHRFVMSRVIFSRYVQTETLLLG